MSTKSKKAATSSTHNNRPTAAADTPPSSAATHGNTAAAVSTTASAPTTAASPSPTSEQRCYCSDPRPLQSDLICSHNTASCNATHVSCLRDNNGIPFTHYLLGRSCFLCAHCVNRKTFKHPTEMDCTLDSRHGCFYEKRGFTLQKEANSATGPAVAGTVGGATEKHGDKEGEEWKEEVEAVPERDGADGAQRLVDEEVERITNGHSVQPSRRSTRTSADKDNTSAGGGGGGGAAANAITTATTSSTSQWPATSHSHASASSSSSAAIDTSVGVAAGGSAAGGGRVSEDEPLEPKKAKRRGIRDADKKAKAKLVPRCTSPSHFLIDDPTAASLVAASPASMQHSSFSASLASSASSASAASLPSTSASSRHIDKLRTDALLSSISSLYYRPRLVHPSAADVYVSADYDRFEYPTVDALLSPLRRPSVLDDWSPMEVALFEGGVCSYGKDFHAISRLMGGRKTCGQCVDFYYVWKKSGHYAMWKEFGKPVRRRTDSKSQQWAAVEERMRGLSSRQDDEETKRRRAVETEEARERQRMGENGAQEKRAKTETEQSSSAIIVKMEEDSNQSGSGGPKAEGSVSAAAVTVW